MKKTIIIIGAGLAGLSAALQASKEDCDIKLISSMPSSRAQSVMAEGGLNAALNTKGENDSPKQHYEDTMSAGCELADPNAVWNMTQAAPQLVHWLYSLGVQFNTCGYNELDLRNFGGQKKKRTVFAQSDTGKQIMMALIDAVRKKEVEGKIERFSHHTFETLILKDKVCCGCVIRDRYTQKVQKVIGHSVIIASGGLHGLFKDTTGSLDNNAEVSARLFQLGVPMANLEMIQYHPTTVEIGGKRMLISEAARAEGGRLFAYRDGNPWYFMEEKYPELGNLMPRDITAREIWKISHTQEVFLDMTNISNEVINHKLLGLKEDCLFYLQKDIKKEPISVYPGIHYFMGGIYVDTFHRTAYKNLYAAGECCAQYHGANRLGGNSLLGAIYGGKIAAQTACAQTTDEMNVSQGISITQLEDTSSIDKTYVQEILLNAMGVIRNEETLHRGLVQLEKRNGNLALLGQAMIKSAWARKESRGAHWREDFPQRNDKEFQKISVARYDGQSISISFETIPERRCHS